MTQIWERVIALLLTLTLALGAVPVAAAEETPLTRGDVADIFLIAADDYHPDVQRTDILKGYPGGDLAEDRPVSRIQALVMLARAFGPLPTPTGDSARSAFPSRSFTDVPDWAKQEAESVLAAGIVEGTSETALSPDAPVSSAELERLIRRVYALLGTNLRDDFYAAVNKEWLDTADIPAGQINGTTFGELQARTDRQVTALIREIVAGSPAPGTPEAKIKAFYECVMDTETRERLGASPLRPYLDAIESAKTLDDLIAVNNRLTRELCVSPLLGFELVTDAKDSTRYAVSFTHLVPDMDRELYLSGTEEKRHIYLDFLERDLRLLGFDEASARTRARQSYEVDAAIAPHRLDPQAQQDVDQTYNVYSFAQLQTVFPNVDLTAVYTACGLRETDKVLVSDVAAMTAAAQFFDDAHVEDLKAAMEIRLMARLGGFLQQEFLDSSNQLAQDYYGFSFSQSPEDLAALRVETMLDEYLSQSYVNRYFSQESKTDVENMIQDFLKLYAKRLENLDWMSAETKTMALKKLETMRVKVGYPDQWSGYLDSVEIKSPAEGGTYFDNAMAIRRAYHTAEVAKQDRAVDKDAWDGTPYTVNAWYDPKCNDITFPAAILQAPLYDVNASREENLGGIGFVIAHEITHAFDNNGAKFDENGNAADWWKPEDYAAFQSRCQSVIDWYDGWEAMPGIACNGAQTISENVADLGAVACITEAASELPDPDYEALFCAVARLWRTTCTRTYLESQNNLDLHAPEKLRANRTLQTLEQFYQTFGIKVGDGMWTDPAVRVSVW